MANTKKLILFTDINHGTMKITALLSFLFFLFASVAHAQKNYTIHTLQNGETLSALAQHYSTTVGDIMRLNGMHADTKLVYGSSIKIPSSANNNTVAYARPAAPQPMTETKTVVAAPAANANVHVVEKGETLYSISKKYNVSITQLQIINKLPDLKVSIGQQLILKQGGTGLPVTNTTINDTYTQPAEKNPVTANTNMQQDNNQPAVEDESYNHISSSSNTDATDQPEFKPIGEGYFASQFSSKKLKKIEGTSMIFKTASGWSDGKYYILMNEADPGSIVKVTAPNGKTIYAKVLWNMGDLKENEGINFRISDAAATALNLTEDKFDIDVSYSKRNAMN